nr:hypothetical protein [Tanacetum cinerariifolium]
AKAERIAEGNKRKWENSQSGNRNNNNNNNNNNRGNYKDNTRHHQYNNQRQGNARAMTTAPTDFSHLIDIDPVRLDTSYEVKLADGRGARATGAAPGTRSIRNSTCRGGGNPVTCTTNN